MRKNVVLTFLAFLIFFLPRINGLGWDITSYDCRYWRPRMRNFVEAIGKGDFKETYQKYHPGVTLMWLSGFAERSFEWLAEWKTGYNQRYRPKWYPVRHFVAKFPLVFCISVLGAVCFCFIRKFTNTKFALIFSFLLSLEPFFLGTTRFLHLSGLTAMLMFTSFLLMFVYISYRRSGARIPTELRDEAMEPQRLYRPAEEESPKEKSQTLYGVKSLTLGNSGPGEPTFAKALADRSAGLQSDKRYFITSAVLLGLAVLTKMDGVLAGVASLILLFFSVFRVWADLRNVQLWKKYLSRAFVYGLVAFFAFFAFWPAMWFDPVGIIRKMISEGIYDTAFASTGAMMLVPIRHLYYFEAFFLRSLPTTVIFVALFPFFFLVKGGKKFRPFMLSVLIFLFVNWVILSIPGKTKDRYLVNFLPALAVLAAFSLYRILEIAPVILGWSVLGLLIGYYVLTIYRYHPVYSFYYNDLIGGAAGIECLGLKVINRGEYWAQAAQFINRDSVTRYLDEPTGNLNTIVTDREQIPSFKDYFKGKTYADSKFMPDGYHAHYVVTRKDNLDWIPEACELIATFGPRAPWKYNQLYTFSCGRTVDNSYKFKN